MVLYFDPDFRALPTGDASEAIARMLFGVVQELCQQRAYAVQRVRLAPSNRAKLLGILSESIRGNIRLACPTLQHFAVPDSVPEWAGVRQIVTGIHTLLPAIWRRYGCHLRDRPITAVVQNIEHKLRRTRPTQLLNGQLRELNERWNIAGLQHLDRSLANCDLLFLSAADWQVFTAAGIECRSRRFIGYCTILPDALVDRYRASLAQSGCYQPRLLFVANGANQDNRNALTHFLSHLVGTAMEADLIVCGGGWEQFDVASCPATVRLNFLGYVNDLAKVLTPGAVGLNLDLAGSGIKTKAMDYLAIGLPFLSSPAAVQGMPAAIHQVLPVHASPQEMLRASIRLMAKENWWAERERLLSTVSNWATRREFCSRVATALFV